MTRTPTNGPQAAEKLCPVCGQRYDAEALFCQREGAVLITPGVEVDPYVGRTLFEQFRIDEVLGRGGMGTVYRAHQLAIGRDVAVKILHRSLVQNADAVRRFQREVRLSTALDHENLVRVFLFGQLPDGSLYLVMEYLDGDSLTEALVKTPVFGVERAVHVLAQLASGLSAAHARGVVHRDVKPENIQLIHHEGDPDWVKVLDFGIARSLTNDQTNLTQSGVIFGTARYISPEGASGEPTDTRSDVYSMGVLAYQLLSGETPFDAPSPVAMLLKHVHTQPPDLRTRNAAGRRVPKHLASLVMRCLAKKPDQRPADAAAFAEALRRATIEDGLAAATQNAAMTSTPSGVHRAPLPAAMVSSASIAEAAPSTKLVPQHRSDDEPEADYRGSRRLPVVVAMIENTPAPAARPYETGSFSAQMLGLGPDKVTKKRAGFVVLACVAGALALGGVFAYQRNAPERTVVVLLDDAKRAFDAARYDGEGEDDVDSITLRVLAVEPDNERALELRTASAEALLIASTSARHAGDLDRARAFLERARPLLADDARIDARLAEIGTASVPQQPPSIRVEPDPQRTNQPFTIELHTGHDVEVVQLRILKGRRVVEERELRAENRRDFVAHFTLAQSGEYEVIASVGAFELRTELDVDGTTRRTSAPPAVITQGASRSYAPLTPVPSPSGTNATTPSSPTSSTPTPTSARTATTVVQSGATQAPLITRVVAPAAPEPSANQPSVARTPTTAVPPSPPPPWTGGD